MNGKLESANILYEDDTLMDKFIMMAGGDRFAIADAATQKIREMYLADPKTGNAAAKAMRAFITGTNFFSISMRPDDPIDREEIMKHWQAGTIGKVLQIDFSGG